MALAREIPEIFLIIKHLGILHVISAIDAGLKRKKVLGIANVAAQRSRHALQGLKERWKNTLVGLQNRIVGVGGVEHRIAIISIERNLHRVAYVVETSALDR